MLGYGLGTPKVAAVAAPHARSAQARLGGEAAVSADVNGLGALLGLFAALWLARDGLAADLNALLEMAIGAAAAPPIDALWLPLLHSFAALCAPPLGGASCGAALAGALQTRAMFSLQPLQPDFARLSPGRLFENLFSTRQFYTLGKLVGKLLLLGGALYLLVAASLDAFARLIELPVQALPSLAYRLALQFIAVVAALYVPLAALDYAHQHFEFVKRQRMSVEDFRREYRDDEGHPQLKSRRRALAREIAAQGEGSPLARASVLVTNPTHVAVALRYEPGLTPLPIVVAKGADAAALALRREAAQRGIPVVEDTPLARRLFARVALCEPIGEELFGPVASVFRQLPPAGPAAASGGVAPAG